MNFGWMALAALVPLMAGQPPGQDATLVASLCNGGSISLALNGRVPEHDEQAPAKGCHAGHARKREEPGQ